MLDVVKVEVAMAFQPIVLGIDLGAMVSKQIILWNFYTSMLHLCGSVK